MRKFIDTPPAGLILASHPEWRKASRGDVWQAIWVHLRGRRRGSVEVRHVHAHLSGAAVASECISTRDHRGNACADALATEAVHKRCVPAELISAYLRRCDLTKRRQRFVIEATIRRARCLDVHVEARKPVLLQGQDASHFPCWSPIQHVESDVHDGLLVQRIVFVAQARGDEQQAWW